MSVFVPARKMQMKEIGDAHNTEPSPSLPLPCLTRSLLLGFFFFNFVIFLIFRITDKINIKNYYYYILSINVSINFLNPILKIIIIVIKFGWGLIDMSSSGHVLLFDMV